MVDGKKFTGKFGQVYKAITYHFITSMMPFSKYFARILYHPNTTMSGIRYASICLLIGLFFGLLAIPNPAAGRQVPDWTGEWQTFWRTGQAVISLHQEGSKVTGTYEPGSGSIEAEMRDGILYGTWEQRGAKGGVTFALAGDGQTFTGRYDNGEYWNGRRVTDA